MNTASNGIRLDFSLIPLVFVTRIEKLRSTGSLRTVKKDPRMKYEDETIPWRKTFYSTATKEWFEVISLWYGEEVVVYLCNLDPSPIPPDFLAIVRSSRKELLRDHPEIKKWAPKLWMMKGPPGCWRVYNGALVDFVDAHKSYAKDWVRWMRNLLGASTVEVLGWLWRLNWTRKKVPWHIDMIHSPIHAISEYLKSAPQFKEQEVMPIYRRWLATRGHIADGHEEALRQEIQDKFIRYKEDKKAKAQEEWDRAHPPKPHHFHPRYAVKRRRMYE